MTSFAISGSSSLDTSVSFKAFGAPIRVNRSNTWPAASACSQKCARDPFHCFRCGVAIVSDGVRENDRMPGRVRHTERVGKHVTDLVMQYGAGGVERRATEGGNPPPEHIVSAASCRADIR